VNDSRQYPVLPVVGVGAVVVEGGKVLLVKRKYEPLAGQWSIPGGGVEVGETLTDCVAREIREETGLDITVGPVVEVLDRIMRDDEGRVRYHFVLVDYLCWVEGGALQPASDVLDARFVDPADLPGYGLAAVTTDVIGRALDLDRAAPRPAR
jgi:ADP-ribose pyrophosphatase YjhB (NUDIX family)